MKVTAWISIAIAMSTFAGPATMADPETRNHGINKRQENQQDRLRQGVKSSESTGQKVRGISRARSDVKAGEEKHDEQQR
jgi:hypothetical protein